MRPLGRELAPYFLEDFNQEGTICLPAAGGIGNVYQYLQRLEKEQGINFQPSSLLKEMAEGRKTFYKI